MKRLMAVLFASLLLVSAIGTPVLADPPPYQEDPNPPWWSGGHKAIVTDPLESTSGGTEYGYIRFLCQSQEGFEYSVGVKSLSKGKYTVEAVSLGAVEIPGVGPVPTSDVSGVTYSLGTINVKPGGDGEVKGMIAVPSTHVFLPFGLYGWEIRVVNAAGNVVLVTLFDDPVDFQVFP